MTQDLDKWRDSPDDIAHDLGDCGYCDRLYLAIVNREIVDANPASRVELLREKRQPMRVSYPEEETKLMEARLHT